MPDDPTDPDLPLSGASPLTAYARFWRRFAVFSGRASLSEYWWTALISSVVSLVLGVLGGVLLGVGGVMAQQGSGLAAIPNSVGAVLLFLLVVFGLAQIVPSIALTVRRLHDTNHPGLFVLFGLFYPVGGLIILVFTLLPSNTAGRRYDRGAAQRQPAVPPLAGAAAWQPTPPPPAALNGGLDAWPAPAPASPETAPMPIALPAAGPADAAQSPDDALLDAWRTVGEVDRVVPRLGVQPSWRSQGYVVVRRADGVDVLATNGLAGAEGAAALGPGAEVYLAGRGLGATPDAVADGWRFTIVAAVARRIGASGMHLPAELEQYGALSMTVSADASDGWRGADGSVGVLIGVGLPWVPESVATAAGEIRLVGLTPLRPDEIRRILDGGREARAAIAARLAALPPELLTDPDRPAV